MKFKKSLLLIILSALLAANNITAQNYSSLRHSTPEKEGVSSKAIAEFLDAASASKTEFHSFILLRHGKVIAEGWWNPYRPELKHTLYSCSKSFTATAVGFAVQERLLSVDDKVVSFFPNDLPDSVSGFLAALTIKDALIMSDGQEPDPSYKTGLDSNWVRAFLSTPVLYEPGSSFLYNSLGTYMLSAIVQKVTGQKIVDYLKPRLFEPLGIEGMDWETDTKGINTGGWGLRLKTEDMAKFAQLFLQKGKWGNKQVLPASWIEEASTTKIIQHPEMPQAKRDSSDWEQGYCYQMWRCRNNAYRGDGAFGQYMIVMPEQDAAIAITAETPDMQEEINLVWKYLLPAMQKEKLSADKASYNMLAAKLKSLALPAPVKNNSPISNTINEKIFSFTANERHISNMSFGFKNNICHVTLKTGTALYEIDFTSGEWNEALINKPGPSLTGAAIEYREMLYPAKVTASYTWKDNNTLQLMLRYIESPHTEIFTCRFNDNKLVMDIERSFDYGKKTSATLQGTAQ